ncbi:methionyl-tRNA formyltransferase [Cellulophaga lytica]|uniref:Methionyl-tRNA formyltransferase n=1 Tax=Cellulophaga lytica (strain ATCC 23178 / DSM 7489 / JCM 8516 / NBRC 14961 / NCIMB 1423 / VKM B-1433 / Cy l20) TaxID=867900 RepID=F0REI1_CELLC|nr:methionyl-tRNA formyltransferase [Cellulophaga lytica]ADY30996.1 Methionyl-tRNA formyltransferase [Cellulophaga lytica DSM 7489]AIM61965.1 methionyl-tRNA formyltransferase [Cellulophaga lytica]WQG78091.1 methionyl-tRNA formyltransferase [Cellulophaga lytica]
MSNLRIVFMGTPDFAVTILNSLIQHKYNVVGVITAPDKPAGRGRKIHTSAVKQYAEKNNLTILQPTNLKAPAFIEELKALEANLQIVVAFRMLPKVVWQMPKYGTFNLHASLLPQYRGAAPINWAIINGETETGVTTFFIDDKIDTGETILHKKTNISATENAGALHDKLMHLGAELVIETVELIEKEEVTTKKQEENSNLKLAYKIHKDTCKIDWTADATKTYNLIRGLSPYPAAWTTLYNNHSKIDLKIYTTELIEETHNLNPGKLVFDKKTIKVAVPNGYIKLLEIQLSGKRRMKTSDVLNGLQLKETAYLD